LSNGIFKTPESNPKRALKSIAIINNRHNRHQNRHKGTILTLKNNIFTFKNNILTLKNNILTLFTIF